MKKTLTTWCATCALATTAVAVQTPLLLYEYAGDSEGDGLGVELVRVGDFDLDGVPDFAIGIPDDDAPWIDCGRVLVRSGATGAILKDFVGPLLREEFGYAIIGLGDIDADSIPDLAVGSRLWGLVIGDQPGAVRILSGATGAQIRMLQGEQHDDGFGTGLAFLGDLDADGQPEFAVRSTRFGLSNAGRIQVFSTNGVRRYQIFGRTTNDAFGASMAPAGDVDGDGRMDLIIGATGDSQAGDRTGRVTVVRGHDGGGIHAIHGEQLVMTLGSAVASAGDIDGDGKSEFLAGANNWNSPSFSDAGLVRLYSGATGAVLRQWQGTQSSDSLGESLDGGFDVTGDGVPDVIAGHAQPSSTQPGRVRVFSGSDGAIVFSISGAAVGDSLGDSARFLGDLNGDGRSEFGAGAPGADPAGNGSGRAYVWTGCVPPRAYCTGKVNSLGCIPNVTHSGAMSLSGPADNFFVQAQNIRANAPGLMIWSVAPNSTPFGGGTLCILPPLHRTAVTFSGGTPGPPPSCTGVLSFHFSHTFASNQGFLPGARVYCQFWSRDVGVSDGTGLSLSNALEVTVCP